MLLFSLSGQAEAAVGLGRRSEAEELLQRVAAAEEEEGPSPQLTDTWMTLAALNHSAGRDSAALAIMNRAVAMQDSLFGSESAPAREARFNRLPLLRAVGRERQALDEALALSARERERLWWTTGRVSEREALTAAETRSDALSAAIELSSSASAPADAAGRAWDELIRSRSLVFRIQAEARARRGASGTRPRRSPASIRLARTSRVTSWPRARGLARLGSIRSAGPSRPRSGSWDRRP